MLYNKRLCHSHYEDDVSLEFQTDTIQEVKEAVQELKVDSVENEAIFPFIWNALLHQNML